MVAVKKDKISGDSLGTGRRKTSIARVRVRPGSGKITINGRGFEQYFLTEKERRQVTDTLDHVGQREAVDVLVRVSGGGSMGQAGAIRMGLARALVSFNEKHFPTLRSNGF